MPTIDICEDGLPIAWGRLLPDSPAVEVDCPLCGSTHIHGGYGQRQPHCSREEQEAFVASGHPEASWYLGKQYHIEDITHKEDYRAGRIQEED